MASRFSAPSSFILEVSFKVFRSNTVTVFSRPLLVNPFPRSCASAIPDTPGVHGIALAHDLGKGFTSNGRENTVTVFDLKTLKETSKIKLEGAENLDAILYDPSSKRVFTLNGRSKNATAIDAASGTVAENIPLDGKP